jgi:cysteine-rich repeat protein
MIAADGRQIGERKTVMNFFKKSSLFLVAALFAAPALNACSSSDNDQASDADAGTLGLKLQVNGRQVDVVHYEIKRAGVLIAAGDLNVASAHSLSFRIGGLAAGSDYTIDLSANTVDGVQTCSGSAPFTVVAGSTTAVNVLLNCRDISPTTGSIDVNGSINQCPSVSAMIAFPLEAYVGESISLSAASYDPDAGDVSTFAWSEGGVVFANTAAASYACTAVGAHDLVVIVNDGDCSAQGDVLSILCSSAPGCGNGELTPDEECDDGNNMPGDGCDSVCRIEACGNGRVDAGEFCDDGNTVPGDGCSAICQAEGCGNGVVDPGEECDTSGASATCTAACTSIVCGDGEVDAPEVCDGSPVLCAADCLSIGDGCGDGNADAGEECDDGNSNNEDACRNDCTNPPAVDRRFLGRPAACETCVTDYCVAGIWDTDVLTDCPATDTECSDILVCEWNNADPCVNAVTSTVSCFCGDVDPGVCQTLSLTDASVNGDCKELIQASLAPSTMAEAFERFSNPSYAAGRAHQVANCAAAFCPAECGL